MASQGTKQDLWGEIEQVLRESESRAVAGQFSAAIMHEINNPLEAISNLAYLVEGEADNPVKVREYIALQASDQVGGHRAGGTMMSSPQNMQFGSALEPMSTASFPYRILVVEDDPLLRDLARRLLGAKGYEVLTAEDGFVGLTALKRSLPDVIISDLRMPNMNGFEFLSVVRRRFPRSR